MARGAGGIGFKGGARHRCASMQNCSTLLLIRFPQIMSMAESVNALSAGQFVADLEWAMVYKTGCSHFCGEETTQHQAKPAEDILCIECRCMALLRIYCGVLLQMALSRLICALASVSRSPASSRMMTSGALDAGIIGKAAASLINCSLPVMYLIPILARAGSSPVTPGGSMSESLCILTLLQTKYIV